MNLLLTLMLRVVEKQKPYRAVNCGKSNCTNFDHPTCPYIGFYKRKLQKQSNKTPLIFATLGRFFCVLLKDSQNIGDMATAKMHKYALVPLLFTFSVKSLHSCHI